jgi:excisionase family DNA binding protein
VPQVAELLNVREQHVYRLVYERRIPHVKVGRLLRFDPDELTLWIDSGRVAPTFTPKDAPRR